jgi:VanZ family protein
MAKGAATWWLLTLLWCGVIFGLTAAGIFSGPSTGRAVQKVAATVVAHPQPQSIQKANTVIRKTAHVVVFAILGALAWQALRTWPAPRRAALWAWCFAALYACSDEFHQRFVSGRTGTIRDVALDAAAAALVILWLAHRTGRRRNA